MFIPSVRRSAIPENLTDMVGNGIINQAGNHIFFSNGRKDGFADKIK